MLKNVKILVAKKSNLLQSAVSILEEDGVVIIRDLFKKKIISDLDEKWKLYFRKPTVSGTIGYHRTSHPKADIPAFLLGRPSLEVALEKKVINIIEKIMKSECTLSEANAIWHRPTKYTYFPIHTDFKIGWKKSSNSKVSVSEKDLKKPLGIGTMLYMHDTSSGAFSYSLGSHKLKCKNGQHLENYPPEVRQEIKKNIRICKGKKGDLVIFDDRGFHGPDQPSNAHRSVLLFDYYRNDTFGSVVVVSHLVRITDLAHLNK